MSSGFDPDEHTAKICWQVLQAAIVQLSNSLPGAPGVASNTWDSRSQIHARSALLCFRRLGDSLGVREVLRSGAPGLASETWDQQTYHTSSLKSRYSRISWNSARNGHYQAVRRGYAR